MLTCAFATKNVEPEETSGQGRSGVVQTKSYGSDRKVLRIASRVVQVAEHR